VFNEITPFVRQLPVRDLSLSSENSSPVPPSHAATLGYGSSYVQTVFGSTDQIWPGLQTLRFCGTVWYDYEETGNHDDASAIRKRVTFSEWSFKTLVVDIKATRAHNSPQEERFFAVFLNAQHAEATDAWWPRMDRIEMRIPNSLEEGFRRRLAEAQKAGPLARLQQRILPMVVFVDEDGTERKLISDDQSP
jgi:hypothetical protein